jgi:signal transduction histidine kinase
MDFSKPSTPKSVITNINESIEDAIKLSSVTMRKTRIKLVKTLYEKLPSYTADPHLIEEVILNLITNSIEALKDIEGEKIVEILSSIEENHIVVSVSDSGPGIPSDLRNQIFDPFYTTKIDGTGIGLSICQRIIIDHGGSLNVSESKWGGATFTIEFPLRKE